MDRRASSLVRACIGLSLACGRGDATSDPSAATTGAPDPTTTGPTTGPTTESGPTGSTTAAPTGTTGTADALPPAPVLLSPADGATDVSLAVELC